MTNLVWYDLDRIVGGLLFMGAVILAFSGDIQKAAFTLGMALYFAVHGNSALMDPRKKGNL